MHARKRQEMTSEANDGGKEARTNAMLISVGTAFLVLVTPISIAHTYTVISGINFFKVSTIVFSQYLPQMQVK